TRRSCSGLVKLCRKPTATASTCCAASVSIARLILPSSSGTSTAPWASMRSRTGSRHRRGTSGGGRSMLTSYCSNRFSWRISTTSRKPPGGGSAVLAPFRSMIALVASVVPWMIRLTSPAAMPASATTARSAASTPPPGAPDAGPGRRRRQRGEPAVLRGAGGGQRLGGEALLAALERHVGEGAADVEAEP